MHNANFRFKITYLFLLSVVFSISINSQAQNINYGIKGGLNIAETSLKSGFGNTESKTGFNIYIFGDYNFTRTFSISTEAGYTQKGFKYVSPDYTIKGESYSGTLNANLNYIDITVSAKFRLTKSKVVPYLKIGPSLGIKVANGINTEGNAFDDYYIFNFEYFLKNIYENSFGIKSGAGVEIGLSNKAGIIFEINYNFDLTEIYEPPWLQFGITSWSYSQNVKNNVLELSAGVEF